MFQKFTKVVTNKYFNLSLIILSYLFLALAFRFFVIKENSFYPIYALAPLFFSLAIIFLNVLFIKVLPKIGRIIYYLLTVIINTIFIAVQYFHYQILGSYFTISEIFLSKEGLTYLYIIPKLINYKLFIIIIIFLIILFLSLLSLLKSPRTKLSLKSTFLTIGLIILCHLLGLASLLIFNNNEKPGSKLSPFYNYVHLEVPNRSIQSIGIMEYNIHDIIHFISRKLMGEKELKIYEEDVLEFMERNKPETNAYTGLFKNKNLIYIMLESGDDWLITEEYMPTLTKLKEEGLNFTNRYSPFFYGGYTFNAEFAANTGLYLTTDFNASSNNYFPYSLPNLFKNAGYTVNSFHMNAPSFYERGKYHLTFGYSNYYGDYNTPKYKEQGYNYVNDEAWLDNPETANLLIPKNQKFMSFLITYSMHLPYINNELCDAALRNGEITYNDYSELELKCLHYLSTKSDLMLSKLLAKLEEDNIIDNTVIIIFADHDTYGFSDKEYLAQVKHTKNIYLQQKTPLIIWSKNLEHQDIDTLMDTADLVPTIANLFGLDFNPRNYLSTDVFSQNHAPYVYFQYGNELKADGTYIDNSYAENAPLMLKYNEYLLKTDYYRKE